MKKTLLALLLGGTALSSVAADYYLVVPVKGRTAIEQAPAIKVALNAYALSDAYTGEAYSYDLKPLLTVTGDTGYTGSGVTWSVISSSLPAGLALSADGRITGTPTSAGTGTLTARATYKGVNGEQTYQVVAKTITVSLTSTNLPSALIGTGYSYDFKPNLLATNDPEFSAASATWTLSSGTLPAGLSLGTNGVLAGITPVFDTSGASFTVSATYRNKTAQQNYTLYPGDPYFSSLALLLSGNAAPITDSSSSAVPLTAAGVTSTAGKFGQAATFSGTSAITGSTSKFAFGTGAFTMEGWVYFNDVSAGGFGSLTSDTESSTSRGVSFWLTGGGSYRVRVGRSVVGEFTDLVGPGTLTANQWYHVAVVREPIGTQNNLKLFLNGTLVAQTTDTININHTTFAVGRPYAARNQEYMNGRIDDFRVTAGVARYSTNFTPSSYPSPAR